MSSASIAEPHGSDKAAWDAAHAALRGSFERWCRCAFVGLQRAGETMQEMRLCPECGTSLARSISIREAVALLVRLIDIERVCLDALANAGHLVGGLLQEQRQRLGLTPRQLAGQLSLSTATLIRIERGMHPFGLSTARRLLVVLSGALPLALGEVGDEQR